MNTIDILNKLDSKYQSSRVTEIVEEVKQIDSICKARSQINQNLISLEKEYNKGKEFIEHKLEQLRLSCKHQFTTFYPSPCGGSDSWTCCDICGKDL